MKKMLFLLLFQNHAQIGWPLDTLYFNIKK